MMFITEEIINSKKKKLRKNPASQLLKYLFKEYVELYKGLSVSNLIYYES